MNQYAVLLREINSIKILLGNNINCQHIIDGWMNKKTVLKFLDYSDNQLRTLEKRGLIKSSKIGRRKFYKVNSIINLIEQNA